MANCLLTEVLLLDKTSFTMTRFFFKKKPKRRFQVCNDWTLVWCVMWNFIVVKVKTIFFTKTVEAKIVVLLICYSDWKLFSESFVQNLSSKNNSELFKYLLFEGPANQVLEDIKCPLRMFIATKESIEFHNPHSKIPLS